MSTGLSFPCQHCGLHHSAPCPRIKAVEYYPDGTVKRVEYIEPQPTVTFSARSPFSDEVGR